MDRLSCFFIGHRDTGPELFPELRAVVEKHITEYGVSVFIVGHYGSFDQMAAKALILAKKTHPHIELVLLTPYHPGERPVILPEGFDQILYPHLSAPPRKFAIVNANRYAVTRVDFLIAYCRYSYGNTVKLLEYARKRGQNNLRITLIDSIANNT